MLIAQLTKVYHKMLKWLNSHVRIKILLIAVLAVTLVVVALVGGYVDIVSGALFPGITPYIIAFMGAVLFIVRQRYRLAYAFGEIVFGVYLCLVLVGKAQNTPGTGFGIVSQQLGGLYVIVRGFDNVAKVVKHYPQLNVSGKIQDRQKKIKTWWLKIFGSFD